MTARRGAATLSVGDRARREREMKITELDARRLAQRMDATTLHPAEASTI
jgi:hypothetical protein